MTRFAPAGMLRMLLRPVFAAAAVVAAGVAAAGDGLGSQTGAGAAAMAQAELAERLTSHALASNDALALTMAARLKLSQPGRAVERQRTNLQGPQASAKAGPHPRSAAALLARARAAAQGRADLLALLDDIAQERPRGIEDGPKLHSAIAASLATHTYREAFRPEEAATVLIAGDGDSNLDLYVFDAAGRRICASEELDDVEVCRWRPPAAARYTIHVVNRGRADNRYEMRSN